MQTRLPVSTTPRSMTYGNGCSGSVRCPLPAANGWELEVDSDYLIELVDYRAKMYDW